MAGSAEIRAGGAYVEVSTRNDLFMQGMRAVEKRMKKLSESAKLVGRAFLGAGLAIGAPIAAMVLDFVRTGSALLDMSNRTGLSVESLSILGYAASQTGAELSDVETGVRKMQKSIVALANGSPETVAAFQK